MTRVHRQALEEQYLKPISSGGGLFGTSKVDLKARKAEALRDNPGAELPEGTKLGGLLEDDGIYIDNAFLFKAEDINVQKLEERMLNTGQREYFKANGEVRIDNDLLADELTRPADLAFVQSDAFQTVENNAIVTDRLNSFKKRYYRIDIIVGKLSVRRYAELFSEEERLVIRLKHLCKLYDRRVSLALLPFYRARLEYLSRERASKEAIATVNKDLERERGQLEAAANLIYSTWKKIAELRNDEAQTTYELSVHHGADGKDILFNLVDKGHSDEDAVVKARKSQTEATTVYCKLLIDGVQVAETRRLPLKWPSYEVDLSDQFQIHVFTLPSKVQLEIMIKDKLADRLDLVIPGGHVKALTSASRLIKEYEFSRRQHHIETLLSQGDDSLVKTKP